MCYEVTFDSSGNVSQLRIVLTAEFTATNAEGFRGEYTYDLSGHGSVTTLEVPADARKYLN